MLDNIVYTVTGHECNDVPNAVWAIDLTGDAPKTASYALKGKEVAGNSGGVVLGSDGTVYVQTKDTLLALNAPDLKLKSSLAIAGVNTPVVFPYKGQELIVTAGQDRRLYLVDAAPGMALIQQTSPDANVVAGLSTWEDAANARWILASTNNAVSGYKVQERDGKPELVAGWVSRELNSPVPPVIANGVVFAFSMGRTQATLYALDAATGKELYSSRNLVNAPAALSGLTVANGRVYFATTDGTLYCFGIFMEH
jgi:outer membrane protein assembly factor BamB